MLLPGVLNQQEISTHDSGFVNGTGVEVYIVLVALDSNPLAGYYYSFPGNWIGSADDHWKANRYATALVHSVAHVN